MSATKSTVPFPDFTNQELIKLVENGDPIQNCSDSLMALPHKELVNFSILMLFRLGQQIRPELQDSAENCLIQLITGINYGLAEYEAASFDALTAAMPIGNA